ncbi:MAG TPA: hypothetical protein VK961_04320, partial [Chthoniobacter sp.]|nr:hypothetical protein [Chthoniobacter sp.]
MFWILLGFGYVAIIVAAILLLHWLQPFAPVDQKSAEKATPRLPSPRTDPSPAAVSSSVIISPGKQVPIEPVSTPGLPAQQQRSEESKVPD